MKLDNFVLGQSAAGVTVTRRVDRFLPVWEEKTTNGGLIVSEKICILKGSVTSATLAQKKGVYQVFNATENIITINIKTSQEQLQPYTWLHADCDENINFTVIKTINNIEKKTEIKWYRNDDLNTDSEFTNFDNIDFPDTGNNVDDKPAYWQIIPENLPTETKVVYFTYASHQNPVYVYNSSKTGEVLYIGESGDTGEELNNADGNSDFGIYNDYFTVLPGEFIKLAYATQSDFLWEKFFNQTLPLSLELLDQEIKYLQTIQGNLKEKNNTLETNIQQLEEKNGNLETKDSDFEARIKFIEERISAFVRESELTFADAVAYLRFDGMKDCTNWRIDDITSFTGLALRLPRISEGYTDIGIYNNSGGTIIIDHKERDGRILTQYDDSGAILFPEYHRINHGEMWKYKSNGTRWILTRHDNTRAFDLYNEILSIRNI